jgi:hypothetical protein
MLIETKLKVAHSRSFSKRPHCGESNIVEWFDQSESDEESGTINAISARHAALSFVTAIGPNATISICEEWADGGKNRRSVTVFYWVTM